MKSFEGSSNWKNDSQNLQRSVKPSIPQDLPTQEVLLKSVPPEDNHIPDNVIELESGNPNASEIYSEAEIIS